MRTSVSETYCCIVFVQTVTHRQGTLASSAIHSVFAYQWTGDGTLHSIREYRGARAAANLVRTQEFNYDSLGRAIGFTTRKQNGRMTQTGQSRYDTAGRLVHFVYDIPDIPRRETRGYAYNFNATTGNLERMWLASGDGRHLAFVYDELHRLQSRTLTGGVAWRTEFAYRQRTDAGFTTATSLQVSQLRHVIGNETIVLDYRYDAGGNIYHFTDRVNMLTHNDRPTIPS